MPELVNGHQTAFIHGRFIAENFISTREVLHHVSNSNSPTLLLKLDFEKAFDTLDWAFLLNTLAARGFPPKFSRWISHLLSTSSFRIQVNSHLSSKFSYNRGLRQGDPLSPFLFILVVDILQQMTAAISAVVPRPLTNRLKQPIITFQYADDTIFVVSAKGATVRYLLLIIHCFTVASGLRVNLNKSFFVPLTILDRQTQAFQQLLQCKSQPLPIIYLGMPLTIRAPKRDDFLPLLQKLESKLEGWKARFISRAGRLQLVKAVLSSIPTYYMSCFLFPTWLLHRIDHIRKSFLWSRNASRPSTHLFNWQSV